MCGSADTHNVRDGSTIIEESADSMRCIEGGRRRIVAKECAILCPVCHLCGHTNWPGHCWPDERDRTGTRAGDWPGCGYLFNIDTRGFSSIIRHIILLFTVGQALYRTGGHRLGWGAR